MHNRVKDTVLNEQFGGLVDFFQVLLVRQNLSPKLLQGCSLEVDESYYFGQEIRPLYDDHAFPLRRRAK